MAVEAFALLDDNRIGGAVARGDAGSGRVDLDQIKRTGELRYGAIDYPPNWFRDKTTGKWQGFLVEVVEDVAKEMGVKAVPVETTWQPAC